MLTTSDQAALTQTISQSSANDAHQQINQLAGEASQCQADVPGAGHLAAQATSLTRAT